MKIYHIVILFFLTSCSNENKECNIPEDVEVDRLVFYTKQTDNDNTEAAVSLRGASDSLETDAKIGVFDERLGLAAQMAATVIPNNGSKLVNWNAYIYSDSVQKDVSVIDISLNQIHGAVSSNYKDPNSLVSGWYIDGENYAQLEYMSRHIGGQEDGKTWTIDDYGFHAIEDGKLVFSINTNGLILPKLDKEPEGELGALYFNTKKNAYMKYTANGWVEF
ncbi:MAG: hypothetical protein KDE33_25375 [Bacteroidetes bacterium]|nr:hypothetical protein [Bacteroidota bacterium]